MSPDPYDEHLWGDDEPTTAEVVAALEAAGWRWESIEPGCEPVLTNTPAYAWPHERIAYAACGWCGGLCAAHGHALAHLTLGNEVYCGVWCATEANRQATRERRWRKGDTP